MKKLAPLAAAVLAAGLAAACSPSSSSPPAAPASPSAAPASHAATGSPAPASGAAARACAELSAWQNKHGSSAVPPQQLSTDLMSTPDPLSGDYIAWDLAVSTKLPDAEADLLKVWTDCAKAEA